MPIDLSKIDFNTGLLVQEMLKRWIDVQYLWDSEILIATYKEHVEYLDETNMNVFWYMTKFLLDDKYTTKLLLRQAWLSVVEWKAFKNSEFTEALEYAEKVWFPLVIKPTMWTHWTCVYIGIDTREDFIQSFRKVQKYTSWNYFNDILVEKQFVWNEFRIFIDKNWFYSVVSREPANITWDWKKTIEELIEIENDKRMNPRKYCLCTIKINDITIRHLKSIWLELNSIPKKWEKVYVRPNSNVCTWWNCRDVTDKVHPSIIEISKRALNCIPNTPFIGLDLMTDDISKAQTDTSYIICEINANPGISLHTHEETENFKNVPWAIIDILFPETK